MLFGGSLTDEGLPFTGSAGSPSHSQLRISSASVGNVPSIAGNFEVGLQSEFSVKR